jgi:DNA-binding transcriptional regulator YiaG
VGDRADVKVVFAVLALIKRHAPPLRAKRAIEAVVEHGSAVLDVPMVEDLDVLTAELLAEGIAARPRPSPEVDVKAVRAQTALTQEQFAMRYRLDLATLQGWEQGRFQPDTAARNYLSLIAAHPREIERMIWDQPASGPNAGGGTRLADAAS